MGIKLLITEACLIATDNGPVPAEVGDTADVSKEDAATLTRVGRARYLAREDDPTKGLLTATKEDSDQAKARARQAKDERAAREKAAAAASPAGQAELIASIVKATLEAQAAAAAGAKA